MPKELYNETEVIGYSLLCIYLFMAWNIVFNRLIKIIIDRTSVFITDTKNDDILRPFAFFIFNSLFYIMPISLSLAKEVCLLYSERILMWTYCGNLRN